MLLRPRSEIRPIVAGIDAVLAVPVAILAATRRSRRRHHDNRLLDGHRGHDRSRLRHSDGGRGNGVGTVSPILAGPIADRLDGQGSIAPGRSWHGGGNYAARRAKCYDNQHPGEHDTIPHRTLPPFRWTILEPNHSLAQGLVRQSGRLWLTGAR